MSPQTLLPLRGFHSGRWWVWGRMWRSRWNLKMTKRCCQWIGYFIRTRGQSPPHSCASIVCWYLPSGERLLSPNLLTPPLLMFIFLHADPTGPPVPFAIAPLSVCDSQPLSIIVALSHVCVFYGGGTCCILFRTWKGFSHPTRSANLQSRSTQRLVWSMLLLVVCKWNWNGESKTGLNIVLSSFIVDLGPGVSGSALDEVKSSLSCGLGNL